MNPLKPLPPRRLIRVEIAALTVSTLTACAVGPDFNPPKPPQTSGYARDPLPTRTVAAHTPFGRAQTLHVGADIPAQWWDLFHCQKLSDLVEQALQASPTLGAARGALRQAAEQVKAQQGAFYPSITPSFSAVRGIVPSQVLTPATVSPSPYYTIYTGQVVVSYVPDVFGLNRRTVESLAAQEDNARFELLAAYLTLTTSVVTTAIQEANLRGQLQATRQIVEIQTRLLNILKRQFAAGQAAEADVRAQEAALAQAQQTVPLLEKQLVQQRDQLSALLGRLPADEPGEEFRLSDLVLPEDLPISVPANLVSQRPDVRAAEASLHSASALIGVAVANRLPEVELTVTGGQSADLFNKLTAAGTSFFTLLGSVSVPLFDGFALLHRERAARAAFDQTADQYRSTVITAFQNVSDTLKALNLDAIGLQAAAVSEQAAGRSFAISQKLLDLGSIGFLTLLNAQQTYYQAQLSLVQAQAARLADTAALFQALGGGWWNRMPPVNLVEK